jgi:outer membrane immunogenic protein
MRKVCFLLIALGVAGTILAQKGTYRSGVKAGVNLYTMDMTTATGTTKDWRPGFHGGIFFHFPVFSMLSIQPEFLYSQEGVNVEGDNTSSESKLQYLTVPVMFQLNSQSGFYGELGPQFGVLVRGSQTIDNNGTVSELDLKKQTTAAAVAGAAGIGFRKNRFGVNARYTMGLSNLNKASGPERKSNGIQLSFSWSWNQEK